MDLVDLIDLTDETDVQEAKHSTNQSDETVFILKSKVKDELIAHLDFLSDSLKKGHPITEFEINKTDELKKQLNNLPESKKTKSSPAKSTPREVKLIQMQLVLLLHAFKCRNNAKKDVSCRLRYCQRYKNILDHLDSCNQDKACPHTSCHRSKQIIHHWRNCTNKMNCIICRFPSMKSR